MLSRISKKSGFWLLASALIGVALGTAQMVAAKEAYPNKPITMVIPFPPGGPTDVTGRVLAQNLAERIGQAVVVDNRPGASGNIAARHVARSAPDGYTIFFTTGGTHGINPALYTDLGYDPVEDFEPVVWVTSSPNIIVVNKDFEAATLQEFIDLAKNNPGKLSSGAPGVGSTPHMAGELFKQMAGINVVHIPYKGSGPALTDLMGGHIKIMFDGIPSSLPLVESGQIRALAVTSKNRAAAAPDIPTVAETIPGFEATGWFAVYAPAGTPPDVVNELNRQINAVLDMPDVKERYTQLGAETVGGPPERLRDQVATELKKWSALIKEIGLKVE
ncbi:MAG: tripartite tricarboxylate transporter substrate binding protein [Pusillimonas sp.]